jgi:multidrug efflux pump subunit AcrA (membrane-fusion protein)
MARQIFRKEALDRLSSPEQLDQLMQVTSLPGWSVLVALGLLLLVGLLWGVGGTILTTAEGQGLLLRGRGVKQMTAPHAAQVAEILVHVGEVVEKDKVLVRLGSSADDPERTAVASPFRARVLDVAVHRGNTVDAGTTLLTLEPLSVPLHAVLYVPVGEGYQVEAGMDVRLWPASAGKESGPLLGKVRSAARFPATRAEMLRILQSEEMVNSLAQAGPALEVIVELETTEHGNFDSYRWAGSRGTYPTLYSGTPCRGSITIREQAPIRLVLPTFGPLSGS